MANELQALVDAYMKDPTAARREEVVVAALPLVRSIIGRLSLPDHPLVSYEDLEGTGLVGLLEALDSYDPDQAQFSTFAWRRIHGNVVDYLRSVDVLSRNKRRMVAEVQTARADLQQMLGEEPTDTDVADYLDISVSKYHDLLSQAQLRFSLSLFTPYGSSEADTDRRLVDVLEDETGQAGFINVEKEQLTEQLTRVLKTLPERQQTIIGLYYMEDLTLREIGEVLDLTEARISQILGKIVLTLRERLSKTSRDLASSA